MTLFNADDYPSPQDPDRPRRKRGKPKTNEVKRSDGMWHVLSSTNGVLDYCHRIDPLTPGAMLAHGSVLARCGVVGRKLHTPRSGMEVHPCPECRRVTGL